MLLPAAVALLAEGVDRNHIVVPLVFHLDGVALLAEGVDRNRHIPGTIPIDNRSPSSRRAWIEITSTTTPRRTTTVALLAEGVDRNYIIHSDKLLLRQVALLAEGVDRNHRILGKDLVAVPVALLAEGVDRNLRLANTGSV